MMVDHAISCKKSGLTGLDLSWRCCRQMALARPLCSFSQLCWAQTINSFQCRLSWEGDFSRGGQNLTTASTPTKYNSATTTDVNKKHGDADVHGKNGWHCIFDVSILVDTDVRPHHHKCPYKVLGDQEEEKKKYLDTCLELQKDFTPLSYSVDGIAKRKEKAAEKWVVSALAKKWKCPSPQMYQFVELQSDVYCNCTGQQFANNLR